MAVDASIAAVLSGDQQATESLLRSLLPRVRNVARALLGSDSDVDDVAQAALLEVLRGLDTFRGEGPLAAWVDRITIRVALACARRTRLRREKEQVAAEQELLPMSWTSRPDECLDKRQVAELLDAMPNEQRAAVVLHHVIGLSLPEVASEQGVSLETARSRLRLGMSRLRATTLRRQSA